MPDNKLPSLELKSDITDATQIGKLLHEQLKIFFKYLHKDIIKISKSQQMIIIDPLDSKDAGYLLIPIIFIIVLSIFGYIKFIEYKYIIKNNEDINNDLWVAGIYTILIILQMFILYMLVTRSGVNFTDTVELFLLFFILLCGGVVMVLYRLNYSINNNRNFLIGAFAVYVITFFEFYIINEHLINDI